MTTKKITNQQGFSLIELMVGLVIGLIATLVIMQTFSAFEGTKRSTTGISDAQTNGNIGLYMIQRELQFSGYGIPLASGTLPVITSLTAANTYQFEDYTDKTPEEVEALRAAKLAAYNDKIAADTLTVSRGVNYSALKCDSALSSDVINLDTDITSTRPNATSIMRDIITPVTITNGVNSDTIVIRYGTTSRGAMSTNIVTLAGSNYVGVDNNMGCLVGDVVLVTRNGPGTSCFATRVTALTATNGISVLSNTSMAQDDKFACLGQIKAVTFDVNSNQLRKSNPATNVQEPVLNEIVSLQAQYGVATTPNSEIITSWQDATGSFAPTAMTLNDRNRIKAVRIAVVARNNLLEKETVTQLCSGSAAGPARLCVFGSDLNLSGALGADWTSYRYRVYEVIVPLRNMLAASPQL
ncbi:PilW family protein [Methylotenera versatilis]|uniref:PilW family protein n=1 Tax=Methylotenera versatilis TaxID=1055487 RepID=UPI0006469401|nr:PilW family protein [Methylotenera versatilis]